jgi:hypothetical protein
VLKIFFILPALLMMHLFAVNVEIEEDKNISISNIEKDALKSFVKETMNFVLMDKAAFKIAKENRILANEYIKNYGINQYDKARIRVEIEMYLSNRLTKKIQQKVNLPREILYSYYLDNKEKFKKSDKVDIAIFFFKNPEEAIEFYTKYRNKSFEEMRKAVEKTGGMVKEYNSKEVEKLKDPIKTLLKMQKRSKILLPPIVGVKYSSLLFVKRYHKGEGYKSFDEVKNTIKKLLYDKTFLKMRNEILKKYGVQ